MPPLIGITAHHCTSVREETAAVEGQLAAYVAAVAGAGGAPVLVPLDLTEGALQAILDRLSGLVLPGGPDVAPAIYGEAPHPCLGRVDDALDRTELVMVRWAIEADRPLLAICRGMHVLNVALGGTLYQDIPSQRPGALEHHRFGSRGYPPDDRAHDVDIAHSSRLATLLGSRQVTTNSRHHQAIKVLAPQLTAVADTADGLVEAVEIPGAHFAIGVQWHPENLVQEPPARRLFEEFVQAARREPDG